jgi:predicted phosphodiesterase
MRILIISDIHANLTALEAVFSDAGEVDAVWCLGDLVGYGPDPNECIEKIGSLKETISLLGNHDAAALGQIDLTAFNRDAGISARWMQTTLNENSLTFLKNLPEKVVTDKVTLVHGSPRNPVWEYLLDARAAAQNFEYYTTPFCFVGHSHLPVVYLNENNKNLEWRVLNHSESISLPERAILNPGSVGQPRDHDPRAAYAIYLPEENCWEPRRVSYDIASVQKRIYDAGLPRRHAQRLEEGW